MSNDTSRDWEELKKLAEAATPGPWEHLSHSAEEAVYTPGRGSSAISVDYVTQEGVREKYRDEVEAAKAEFGSKEMAQADAAFIAAFNPETILELIAEVERSKGDLERLRPQLDRAEELGEKLAVEFDQLKAERDRMAEALGPMLEMYESCDAGDPSWPDHHTPQLLPPTIGELRRARSALNTGEKTDG